TLTDTTVSDCKTYYYTVRGKDACTPAGNEEGNMTQQTVTPHDYIAPEFAGNAEVTVIPGNGSIAVSWSGASDPDSDLAGYLVVRREVAAPTGVPESAHDNSDGTDYGAGIALGDGLIVYKGANTNFVDQFNLQNGVGYIYKVFAYDTATARDNPGAAVKQQGRNYSTQPISNANAGVVGIAPDKVAWPRAFAGPQPGQITIKWVNPFIGINGFDQDKANNYGGALIVYTNDIRQWGVIAPGADGMTKVDVPIPGFAENPNNPPPTNAEESTKVLDGLNPANAYYFKIFPYNLVAGNNVNTRKVQADGAMTAAMPAAVVQAGDPQAAATEASFGPFVKVDGKLGIFNIVLPFDPIENGNALKISDLVNKVNGNARVVTSISYWDTANQKVVAYIYDKDGNVALKKGTDANPQDVKVAAFMGYQVQISATSNERFILRSK
ncbi:MAG: hypothetical protein WCV91_05590, partial [Candidatus Margulisiibacteriota bacterium]